MPLLDHMPVSDILILSSLSLLASFSLRNKKGMYSGGKGLSAAFIFSLILTALSFLVAEDKIGGTLMQTFHGWPHAYFNHHLRDVIDHAEIDKWHFLPGDFGIYVLSDVLFYFSLSHLALSLASRKRRAESK